MHHSLQTYTQNGSLGQQIILHSHLLCSHFPPHLHALPRRCRADSQPLLSSTPATFRACPDPHFQTETVTHSIASDAVPQSATQPHTGTRPHAATQRHTLALPLGTPSASPAGVRPVWASRKLAPTLLGCRILNLIFHLLSCPGDELRKPRGIGDHPTLVSQCPRNPFCPEQTCRAGHSLVWPL